MTILQQYANNATSTLAAPISAAAVSATLAAGTGLLFPQISGNQYFLATLSLAATGLSQEIVKVTAIFGDTVTMVRAQEGTTANAYGLGDNFEALITAGSLAALVSGINAVAGELPLPVASYAYSALPLASGLSVGTQAFCTNGRNPGEGSLAGTGCLVFVKSISSVLTWCAVWSGIAVTV